MPLLIRPIATRFFLFMLILGMVSSIVTVPPYKDAKMYDNAVWELLLDVYVASAVIMLIGYVCSLPFGKARAKVRNVFTFILRALTYVFMYPLYVIDTFCFAKFGCTLNPTMLLLAGETNGNETSEFFQSYVTPDLLWGPVGIILLVPLLHVLCIVWQRKLSRKNNCRMPIGGLSMIRLHAPMKIGIDVIVLAGLVYLTSLSWQNKSLYAYTMSRETIGQVEHSLAYRPHTEMYQPPMRLAFSIRSNELIGRQLTRLEGQVDRVAVDSCTVDSSEIVLIIGESFNRRHAQLYGYDKKNMPNQVRLQKQGLLTPLQDVVAPWNLTSFVFKHIMTTYCVGDTAEWCDYPLFCEVFRKAGYEVRFLTNQFLPQAKEAVYDFSGGFFINNETLSKAQFDVRNTQLHVFDEGLLQDYDALVKPRDEQQVSGSKHLTIFHLMGMHVNYRIRCPNSKKRWGAGDYPNDMDMPEKRRKIMAYYDNAVWYNDSVVNQIVERFKDKEAVIVYVPDHGEEVFGPGARHFFGRMHDARINKRLADEEFLIPMWIYTTPQYAAKHPETVAAIKAVKNKRYMTDALSHLLMGLAQIHCRYYNPRYDLLSPMYDEQRQRLLKHQTDYDELKAPRGKIKN
ncbi:MAG: phosphoethanolamine transferase [Prevotella sp.]|nr:phosphoethanolamine transferase [Prevotella sp.]